VSVISAPPFTLDTARWLSGVDATGLQGKKHIYDVEGKLVLTQSIRNGYGLERVDVSQLSEGNYVLKMGDFSKQISIMK
jgi:hypothetical protein